MKFENIEVGDEVSVYMTDCSRTFFDMSRYIGREKVIAVTPGTLTTPRGTFLRRDGCSRIRTRYCVRPADDEQDAKRLAVQKKRDDDAKSAKGASK
jgi:hypothetical protein